MTRRRLRAGIDPATLGLLASNLQTVWSAPTTDARLKKRIVRTLIHEVVADIDDEASEIVLIVHWAGGAHSEMRLPKRRRGQRNSTSTDILEAVRQLVLIASDDLIAGLLNRNGLKTGNGNRWTRERVTSMRSNYRIPVFKAAADGIEPWLNLADAAKLLKVAHQDAPARRRSRRDRSASTRCRTDPWIFAAVRADDTTRHNPSPNGRGRTPSTPRDRIPRNKASSLQSHSQMGVLMRGCRSRLWPIDARASPTLSLGPQIHLLVFDRAPQPLDEHVVPPGALAIHADRDAVALEHAGEGRAGELRALVGVEDLRLAVTRQGFLQRLDAESVSMVIDNRHASTVRLYQSRPPPDRRKPRAIGM